MGSRQYHPNPPTVSVVLFCCIFIASCSAAHAADPLWKCFLFLSLFLFGEGESLDWQPVFLLFTKEGFLVFEDIFFLLREEPFPTFRFFSTLSSKGDWVILIFF